MAEVVNITAGTGTPVSAPNVSNLNGSAVTPSQLQRAAIALRTALDTAIDLPGDATNGLDVDVTRLPALPAGTNVIGTVKVQDGLGIALNAAGTGFLKVTDEPKQLFYDSFDAAPDVTNMWNSTSAGGGVAPAVSLGVLSMGTGTTANGYSKFSSIPTFKPTIPGWLVFSDAIALPDGAAPLINSYRFWGSGTTPASPTVAAPITDGYGFELNTDQKLRAVVYAGGTRTVVADLSSSGTNTQPLNATYHRYIVVVRTDRTFFYIDTFDTNGLVASTSFNSSQAQILPKLYLNIANTPTAPVSNVQIQSSGAVVSDTAKNHTQLSDGTFPWRKASVSATGALSVINAGTFAVQAAATLAAETTKVIGTVNVSASVAPTTYSAAINGLALAATATDVFTLAGSASKTIRIMKVAVNGIQTTAGQVGIVLLKRSSADTAGTSTAPAKVPYDSANAAATAVCAAYTANPTTGTLVGNIFTQRVFFPGAATASDAQGLSMAYGDVGQQSVVLRGAAEQFAVNLAGVSVVGGSANISVEWSES